jgi:Ran GTPase-activating protein (RanGAP) involved in mRNA processing and transport
LFADILQYIPASYDVGAVCLAAAQTNSQIRDKITPFVFKEHHTVTRFHRASPEQSQFLLETFISKSRNTAVIDALVLRETRTEPGKALKLVAGHRPLQLKVLDLYKTDLTWETDSIVDALVQCTNLTSITLSDCNITSRVLQDIAPTILQQLPNLKRLDLSNNKFRVDGAVALASMECFISAYDQSGNNNSKVFSLPNLEQLDLGGNSLGNKGIDALLRLGFPGKFTPNLQLLDLRNNALNDDGARTVMRYLARNMRDNKESPIPKLNVLELCENGISADVEQQLRELFFKVKIFVN